MAELGPVHQFFGGGGVELRDGQQRTTEEVREALGQVYERRWYGRETRQAPEMRGVPLPGHMMTMIEARTAAMEAKYGASLLDSDNYTSRNWGYLAGVQSALCWVLGGDWGVAGTGIDDTLMQG